MERNLDFKNFYPPLELRKKWITKYCKLYYADENDYTAHVDEMIQEADCGALVRFYFLFKINCILSYYFIFSFLISFGVFGESFNLLVLNLLLTLKIMETKD